MATEILDLTTWRRIEGYLEEALDLDKGNRQLWLKRLAKTQPQIARAVGDLLGERDRLNEQGFLLESPIHELHLEDADGPSYCGTGAGAYAIAMRKR